MPTLRRRVTDLAKDWLRVPRGFSLFYDLRPYPDLNVIFDVGANRGQSAVRYLREYPRARIHCFEPVQATYEQLKARFANQPGVTVHNLAFGSENGTLRMDTSGESTEMFRVSNAGSETVPVQRLDDFGADRIDFLKIDTEGHDLEVLKGADRTLREGKVRFVQVEAGMNPGNDWHVPMESMKSFLEERGFYLFGVYEQQNEWPTEKPWLRRSDLVFIRAD
ncbi:MAG TPA: FkbM family methyltransferase, partial [Sphingomicrobium sp.]